MTREEAVNHWKKLQKMFNEANITNVKPKITYTKKNGYEVVVVLNRWDVKRNDLPIQVKKVSSGDAMNRCYKNTSVRN